MGWRRTGAAMAVLDRVGIVRALFGMLDADGDILAATAGLAHVMCSDGTVQRAGDDFRVGRSVVQHLFLDGLRAFLQRTVYALPEFQIGRHVGQIIAQVVKALTRAIN